LLCRAFALQEEFILLVPNGPTDYDLVGILKGETIVTVVKDYFDEGVDGGRSRSFVQEGLAFFLWLLCCVFLG
jgi:hypothetical protein